MADAPCTRCPALHRHIAELEKRNAFLRHLLGQLLGGVRSTLAFIAAEQDTPSLPRRHQLPAIHARLTHVAEQAEGIRV
ncbi:hypothetical protein [Krasilnikovia sp. MM14-A1004]|uniref:hypothetical protein n=1 Tax=Krasilnikovia sp. MM14-A1004 TaxID=3373541 RepID=UPI00399CFEFF